MCEGEFGRFLSPTGCGDGIIEIAIGMRFKYENIWILAVVRSKGN